MFIEKLKDIFSAHANATESVAMAKYMKNHFRFYGLKMPVRTVLTKEFLTQNPLPKDKDALKEIILKLWSDDYREVNYTAFYALKVLIKKPEREDIEFMESLITIRSWWDSVDSLAGVIGDALMKLPPEVAVEFSEKWIQSSNMWVQRTALIYQLKYRNQTDEARLYAYILHCADSKEFFIQKAIGWALRQYSKYNPRSVKEFVEGHTLAPLSRREAIRLIEK